MRIKIVPGDFVVEERANLALVGAGPWAIYRVRKVGLTTLQVQTRLASRLRLPRARVVFPALKDKDAVAIQYMSLPGGQAATIEGDGFVAQRVGYRLRPLTTSGLTGNLFTIVVRDLDEHETPCLAQRLRAASDEGVPNYFDVQRFGSFAPGWGYLGKAILKRDAEGALRAYLTRVFLADPRRVRTFKHRAESLWLNWAAMLKVAPKPSNFRSVLTYLVDHPNGYRKALNLIPQRLLSLYLAAYQSYLWNRIVATYLDQFYAGPRCSQAPQSAGVRSLSIAGQSLPVHTELPGHAADLLSAMRIALPHHRAQFRPSPVARIAAHVLAEEDLSLVDLKARILTRAYMAKGDRPVLLMPQGIEVDGPFPDRRFPGRSALRVRFALPRGSYATLVLKAAAAAC